jgi:serine protease
VRHRDFGDLASAGESRIQRRLLITVIALAVTAFARPGRPLQAQNQPATVPTMSLERAEAFIEAASNNLGYVPGEVLVKFRDGVDVAGRQLALRGLRSRPLASELSQIGDVFKLTDQAERDATILAAQLSAQPEVAYAEPNYLYRMHAVPSDASYSRQWNFSTIDMPTAWDINPGGSSSVIVAVLDSGLTTVNQTLSARTWNGRAIQTVSVPFRSNPDLSLSRVYRPRDFATGGADVVLDMVGHGTHVSATIGEDANALAQLGIAYLARIMPVKVCFGFWEVQFSLSAAGRLGYAPLNSGGCDSASIAAGIRYAADNGARVINLSLGGPGEAQTLRDAINYAVNRGAFVAMAMGNEFEEGNPTEYPAAYAAGTDGAMAVGAVGRSLRRAFYSNTGSHIEITAPGGDTRDGGSAGMIWQAGLLEGDFDAATVIFPRFDRYAETAKMGTSMATPHVSGMAALIMDQGVADPAAVEALIKRTARRLGTSDASRPGWNNEFGYGLIQPRAALRAFGIAR